MVMARSIIFYSWQSDLPNPTNRGFIQQALEKAAMTIRRDTSLDVEPVVDRDTEGIPGSPDISKTIFSKIDQAQVFVCDISIINRDALSRPVPNPNVLLELGYALKALGDKRIIMVLNDVYGGPELLPFDLRMRRVIRYHMPQEADDRATERKRLEGVLAESLRIILNELDKPLPGESIQPISLAEQAEERFQSTVMKLGDEKEGTRISAAILLQSFLRPGYEQFYIPIFNLAVAHLRLPRAFHLPDDTDTPLPPTSLSHVLFTVFKEAFPLARNQNVTKSPQFLDASNIQLDHAHLSGADLKRAWMLQASLRGADLSHAQLSSTNLIRANLEDANLEGADLRAADLGAANLSKAEFTGANLEAANLGAANLFHAIFWKANLRGANLEVADLGSGDLNDANLSDANLFHTNLCHASFQGTNLSRANLRGAHLNNAYLNGAGFSEADLREVDFTDATLEKVDLSRCKRQGNTEPSAEAKLSHLPASQTKRTLHPAFVNCGESGSSRPPS